MNVIAIVGLETLKNKDGSVHCYAETFLNNIKTWQKNNPKSNLKILDARKYVDETIPIRKLWDDIGTSFIEGIDLILYSGHSDDERLYWLSKTRPDLGYEDKFIENNIWDFNFNEGASIKLMGCQAGGHDGKKWNKCIAQTIANNSGVIVWAFTSKSSQQKRNGGYYQIPDVGDYVKFVTKDRQFQDITSS